jgi:tetratricopeptide (TPR) repeat protein
VPWRMDVSLGYAEELIELTAMVDDPQRRALANLWSFVAHLNTGDVDTADRRFEELLRLDRELGQPTLRWLTTVWTTFRRLMSGEFEEAERLSAEGLEIGSRTGQPDAFTWYAAQLFELTRQRGQLPSLLETVQGEVAANPGLPAWQVALAAIHCTVGDLAAAQGVLDEMAPDGVPTVARDVLWLFTVSFLLEVAELVGDVAKTEKLYAAALPYRALVVTSGVTYLGSAERYLAAGARTLGRYDDAVAHLEAALALEERMRARPAIALNCADLARTLRLRGAPDDEERAASYERRARELAAELGSVYIERRLAGHFA